jgi:predicted TIM-barrel fold metal-dependent hydrolase
MHIHAFNEDHPMFGMTHPPTLRGKTYKGVNSAMEQKEKTLEKFRQYNIVKAVVTNGQIWNDKDEETILIGRVDKEIDTLKNQFEKNELQIIAEMSPFYSGIQANDPSIMPYLELAQEIDIPVGFHIFPGGPNYGIHLMPKMLSGMRAKNANPLQLEDALIRFPNLRLYIMHGGWPYIDDVKALMYMHPNVYVDIAVLNWLLPQDEFENYIKALITAGFGNRILFGTDQMVWPETIDDAIESVNAAEFLTLEQKEDIFYDNAAEFLRLTDSEIKKHKGK